MINMMNMAWQLKRFIICDGNSANIQIEMNCNRRNIPHCIYHHRNHFRIQQYIRKSFYNIHFDMEPYPFQLLKFRLLLLSPLELETRVL